MVCSYARAVAKRSAEMRAIGFAFLGWGVKFQVAFARAIAPSLGQRAIISLSRKAGGF